MDTALPAVPIVDVRDGGPLQHVQQSAATARALRDACLGFFPSAALPLVPALDRLARRWLMRSRSPYVPEIAAIAATLDFSGVWLLNASYQWGCTALACERDGAPWLLRTLDWPFTGLGRHTELAHMRGDHGDFFSVTWPGYVGVLTAMAPQRFAASVNQAPMWRRTRHPWLRPYDLAANALGVWSCSDCVPPDQLLRRAFETCDGYGSARRMLEQTRVARPVIYTLVGCAAHERCVIERTEHGFNTRVDDHGAANDWLESTPLWEGRIGASQVLTCTFAEAAEKSRARREGLAHWPGSFARDSFGWIAPPVLNPYTRMAVEMCPARGVLRVVGYELQGSELPSPATLPCEVHAERLPA